MINQMPNFDLLALQPKTTGVINAGDVIRVADPDGIQRYAIVVSESPEIGMSVDEALSHPVITGVFTQ